MENEIENIEDNSVNIENTILNNDFENNDAQVVVQESVELADNFSEITSQDGNEAEELITVRPVKFQDFEGVEQNRTIKKNLDILQDIQMHVSVELGKSKMSIKEVMEMEQGSIVELDKIAGEQVEIYVNKKLVAKGEVIVIEDKFGVRIVSTNLPKNVI